MLNLALPASMIEAVGRNFSQGWRTRKEPSERDRQHLAENLGRVPLDIAIRRASDAGEPPATDPQDRIFAPIADKLAQWLNKGAG